MKNKEILAAFGAVAIAALLDKLKNNIDSEQFLLINQKLDSIMTKQERFDAILGRLDTVTTDIAGDFSTFVEEVRSGTVSEESLSRAEANIATLETLAASKENPVPNDPNPPVEEPTDPEAPVEDPTV